MSSDLRFESQAKADQYQLDCQISSYRDRTRVTRSRARVVSKLEQRRDALKAPVYRLPDDILSMVFKCGAKKGHLVDIKFSFLVSWVTSRWRRVALQTPTLWANLTIRLPDGPRTDRWITLLHRTSSGPLDLCIRIAYLCDFTLDYQPLNLAEILLRCRFLSLRPQGFCLRLRSSSIPFPSKIPLRELHLSFVEFVSLSVLLDLLQACHCLVTLTITGMITKECASAHMRVVELNSLHHLELGHMWAAAGCNICVSLPFLRMPQLNELSLQYWDGAFARHTDFSSVCSLKVGMPLVVQQAMIIDFICGMPLLNSLELSLVIQDPAAEFPANVSVPSLVSIDFSTSRKVDRLARWIVEQTGKDRPGRISVQNVSVRMHANDTCPISPSTREWMEERGIEVTVCGT